MLIVFSANTSRGIRPLGYHALVKSAYRVFAGGVLNAGELGGDEAHAVGGATEGGHGSHGRGRDVPETALEVAWVWEK